MIKRKLETNENLYNGSKNMKKDPLDILTAKLESKHLSTSMKHDDSLLVTDSRFLDTKNETTLISRNSTTDSLSMGACNKSNSRKVENPSNTSEATKSIDHIEGDFGKLKFQISQEDTQNLNSMCDRLTPSRKADYIHTLLSGRDNDLLNNSRDTISPLCQDLSDSHYTDALECDETQNVLTNSDDATRKLEIECNTTDPDAENSDICVEDCIIKTDNGILSTDIDIDSCANAIIDSHQKITRRACIKEKNDNIRVVVRTHPSSDSSGAIKCEGNTIKILKPGDEKSVFKSQQPKLYEYEFYAVFDENSTQDEVYTNTCKDLLPRLFDGNDITVFAYGSTGTGKTFTIMGDDNNTGIIQLSISDLFELKRNYSKDVVTQFSYIEVYNENIYDLLNNIDKSLELQEDSNKVNIQGLSLVTIDDPESVAQLITKGNRHRKIHMTNANRHSSRSHAILQFHLNSDFSSKLTFIDLAGSERLKLTSNVGIRLKEASYINQSLLALINCINSLSEKGANRLRVKYRDSKLTHLLKNSLYEDSAIVMIALVHPDLCFFHDSYNTLKYALRAKNIEILPNSSDTKVSKEHGIRGALKESLHIIRMLRPFIRDEDRDIIKKNISQLGFVGSSTFVNLLA